jgi:hypothetical protein
MSSMSTMLPFTSKEFFEVFAAYNRAIWPAVLIAYLLGLLTVVLVLKPGASRSRVVAMILAAMWGWSGIAYHWLYFSTINPAALLFAAAFVVQSIIFLEAAWGDRLLLAFRRTPRGFVGLALIAYATLVYPILGLASGHHLTELPMFGVTPGPVTIFTLGCILLTTRPVTWRILIIPLLWSLIGGTAALLLGIWQDWMLPVSGAAALLFLRYPGQRPAATSAISPASRPSP